MMKRNRGQATYSGEFMRVTLLAILSLGSFLAHADGEYASSKVKLLAHFDLVQLKANSGSTCWGYVSATGREYALMGCSNKMAIVEVTDPKNAKLIASIPHTDGLWADIKVYKDTAYVSTESSGTGLQVVDLSKIDDGKATLVKTITTPGRSHTIAVDAVGGYLYTCGSNEGVSKGATTCFDLKDPNDPKRVGAPTLTPVYQHESQVVTYTEGKYKGRTVFFGGGEGRGLEIWDVTDKDKTFLMRRVAYPFVGYCHQGWLSSDRKYFYVNDEFDENTNGIATRTLVFDVSDIERADLVSTYSTGKSSIDHNLYTRNDFIFHANYTSGFWVFDANDTPLSPKLCGFFDTYPKDDKAEFNGAWSNYPLLPSGTVLISDINDGLFIVDVTEATKTPVKVTSASTDGAMGELSLSNLESTDAKVSELSGKAKGSLIFEGTAKWQNPSRLSFQLVSNTGKKELTRTVEFFNWAKNQYEAAEISGQNPSLDEISASVKNPTDYIQPKTKKIRTRVSMKSSGSWKASVDQAGWTINP